MKSFFVTFGKGILYFIGLPFLIVFITGYGIYLLGVFFAMLFRTIIRFFQGKPTGIKDEMDEDAMYILKKRKLGNVQEKVSEVMTTNNTNNFSQTINNYNIGMNPEDIAKLSEIQKQQALAQQQNVPEIDTTVKKVDAIDMIENTPEIEYEDGDKEEDEF